MTVQEATRQLPKEVRVNISAELLRHIEAIARSAQNIGNNPPEFYVHYYLNFKPHLMALAAVGHRLGIRPGHKVLEVGSGMGTRCVLGSALWNAEFTGIEPCGKTYEPLTNAIREFRACNPDSPYVPLDRTGEDTGLASESFDFVVSFEVLEHVRDVRKVLAEMHRVLKPGGKLYFSTCNYASFYEGHYRCAWMPWMTPKLGKMWVKMLGRDTGFIDEINFVTKRQLVRSAGEAGFVDLRFDGSWPGIKFPKLIVGGMPGFALPEFRARRSWLQEKIQADLPHRILSRLNMEYKLYGWAAKPC